MEALVVAHTEIDLDEDLLPGGAPEPFAIGRVEHAATGLPLSGVRVEAINHAAELIGSSTTDASGYFSLQMAHTKAARQAACLLRCDGAEHVIFRALDHDDAVIATSEPLDYERLEHAVTLLIQGRERPDHATLDALVPFMQATRRARVSDLTADLANPSLDSPARVFPIAERAALLDGLVAALQPQADREEIELLSDDRFLDLLELRDGNVALDADIPLLPDPWRPDEIADFLWPIFGELEWARPDDESYRDYLRGVFVLYAHQQAVGFAGNLAQWTGLIEQQLLNRFFQDFRTQDRTKVPLNSLLTAVVRNILAAPPSGSGNGLGFGVSLATIPSQGNLSHRAYLDALLALAPITVEEFANRYRLLLGEPDTTISSPVLLNIHTLKAVLSDTAQGPVEPRENAIFPPLPGHDGKPILWEPVVGSAPFFLRFEEWLARQRAFYGENLFSLRTQVQGYLRGGPWLDQATSTFLTSQLNYGSTTVSSLHAPYFNSIDEIKRSAAFLLRFGAADAKLLEVLSAFDAGDFRKALRLAEEAEDMLTAAKPSIGPGENWAPVETFNVNFPRPLSFARRRKLPVTNILQLTSEGTYPNKGLELFFEMPRVDLAKQSYSSAIIDFFTSRGLAVRLVPYQRAFLLPILRSLCLLELGDYAAAVALLAEVTGFHVGFADAMAAPGAARSKNHLDYLRALHTNGSLPYTARPEYEDRWLTLPKPFTPMRPSASFPDMGVNDLHRVEERYVRLLQGDTMLRWAEALYRADDPSSRERARELYKGVMLLHGEDPGTLAYKPQSILLPLPFGSKGNPRRDAQIESARLALFQIGAGLNFYGYNDALVPTLRYRTLINAASRWSSGAKAAQSDFLAYMSRLEQLDLDILAARTQEKKAKAYVQIAAEETEIAKAGVAIAQRLVKDVQKRIDAKQAEIEDADSFFGQFSDYLKGMKDSITSVVDVGKAGAETSSFLSIASDEEIKAAVKTLGSDGLKGVGWGGAAVVGAMAAFATMSIVTLQGMADAANRRMDELAALRDEALPAAQAAVRVQERGVTIAQMQAVIAATELAYATELLAYHGERFLNRDFWAALAGVARRVMRRQLNLAAQAAWFAERALAYEIGRPIRIIRLDYFDARLRDVTGVDRLMLDLAELEAVRLQSANLTVPIRRTYSLARDFPLAFGALRQRGRCAFTVSDQDLALAHPGTVAHRVRAVTVAVEAPGAAAPPRGMLSNRGLSFLRRSATGPNLPLVRFEDGLPVSEFRVRDDMWLYQMPGEQLMSFEGSGFSNTWELEFPAAANPTGLARLTDVLITFDVRAEYAGPPSPAPAPSRISRSLFVSALAVDTGGLASLRGTGAAGTVRFPLGAMSIPGAAAAPRITNLAVLVPGVNTGTLAAKMKLATTGSAQAFSIVDGVAISNNSHLSDGVPANAHPLNVFDGKSPAQTIEVTIEKAGVAVLLAAVRDIVLWVEYDHAV